MTESDARGLATSGPSSSPSWYPAEKTNSCILNTAQYMKKCASHRSAKCGVLFPLKARLLDRHDHDGSKKNTIVARISREKRLLLTTTVAV